VRFSRWREKGVFERVAHAMQGDADMEQLFIDSTIVRAHQHSAGAKKKLVVRKSVDRGVG
jgi:transposase